MQGDVIGVCTNCGHSFRMIYDILTLSYRGQCHECKTFYYTPTPGGELIEGFGNLGKTETVTATPVTVVCTCHNHPTVHLNYEAKSSRWEGVCAICGANWGLSRIGDTPRIIGYTVILDKDVNTHSNPEHYAKDDIEPMAYIVANSMDFLTGNVIKYISRHTFKDKHKDLIKALHYLLLVFQRDYPEEYSKVDISKLKTLKEYLKEPQVVDKTEDEDEDEDY